jgi:hypothetical protein
MFNGQNQPSSQTFKHGIKIDANCGEVEKCLIDRDLMHQWLNPLLKCEPIGEWGMELGAKSRFLIDLKLWQPSLTSTVIERSPNLVVWSFEGFFVGHDRWEWLEQDQQTLLTNAFTFTIPNPLVKFGFNLFAAPLTRRDMQQQLMRFKQVAEKL